LLLLAVSALAFVTLAAIAANYALKRRVPLIYTSTLIALAALAYFAPRYTWDVPFSFYEGRPWEFMKLSQIFYAAAAVLLVAALLSHRRVPPWLRFAASASAGFVVALMGSYAT
jgi:hypothetical protein